MPVPTKVHVPGSALNFTWSASSPFQVMPLTPPRKVPDQTAVPFTRMDLRDENETLGMPTIAVVPSGESTRSEYSEAVFFRSPATLPWIHKS